MLDRVTLRVLPSIAGSLAILVVTRTYTIRKGACSYPKHIWTVADESLTQCVEATSHREFLIQVDSLLFNRGTSFGTVE
jgi:hypothetical protein